MMVLKPITLSNCQIVREWRNSWRESLRTSIMLTEEMQGDFFNKIAHDRNSEDNYWEVHNTDNEDIFVGLAGLTDWERANSIAEISLFIDPSLHGLGYGTKAVQLICEEGFLNMGLRTIFGEAFKCNPHWEFWAKLTTKFGGYMTELPDRKFWGGVYYPSLYFSWRKDCAWQ